MKCIRLIHTILGIAAGLAAGRAGAESRVLDQANSGEATRAGDPSRVTRPSGTDLPFTSAVENVSARVTLVEGGMATVGFVIGGTMPQTVLIRAAGPGLSPFDVTNALSNPKLQLYRSLRLLAANDDWGSLLPIAQEDERSLSAGSAVGPHAAASGGVAAGMGNATGTGTTTGTDSPAATGTTGMANGTGTSGSGGDTGTTGTTGLTGVTGSTGTTGTAATPGSGTGLPEGSDMDFTRRPDWAAFSTRLATAEDFLAAGAFGFATGSKDAALLVTLPPGPYTVVVSTGGIGISIAPAALAAAAGSTGTTGAGMAGTESRSANTASKAGTGSPGSETTGPSRASAGTPAAGATSTTSGDVLVEVYFLRE